MKGTRKGFTLVELLIVIVVIGILSAMMMLSSNEAVTTAKANNITSNLRNLKTAALAYYTDHMTEAEALTEINDATKGTIFGYLGGKTNIPDSADYSFVVNSGKWYVKYNLSVTAIGQASIKSKIKGREKSLGLLNEGYNPYETSNNAVLLRVR